jgi:hypothetical protein
MTDLDKPVVRRTQHVLHGRKIVATMTPGGIKLHLAGTQQSGKVDWDVLWDWIEKSQISIKPRRT